MVVQMAVWKGLWMVVKKEIMKAEVMVQEMGHQMAVDSADAMGANLAVIVWDSVNYR